MQMLNQIQIESLYYRIKLEKYFGTKQFVYADPPHLLNLRNYKKYYSDQLSKQDHLYLADYLHSYNDFAMVRYFESKLYDQLYASWTKIKLQPKGHSMKK